MRFLLDTHVWLWLQSEPSRIRPPLLERLGDPHNTLLLSAASSWEIAIKFALGKLPLPEQPSVYVPRRMQSSGTVALPISHGHALRVAELPMHHADPFDRLLVAQAQHEDLPIVTADAALKPYDVKLIKA